MGRRERPIENDEQAALRKKTTIWAVLFGALVVTTWIGDATAPALVTSVPLLCVSLSSKARNVLLASQTGKVSALLLGFVVVVRRLIPVPVAYRLGQLRGPAVLDWVDRRYPSMGESTRMLERWFTKSRYLAVLAIPGPLTSLLAGVAAMPLGLVLLLSAVGVAIRVVITLAIGEVFERPLKGVLGFLRRYQWQVLIVTVAFVLFTLVREKIGSGGQESGDTDVEVPPPKLGDL